MRTKRITLFAGHYGSGKTNIAINYALFLAGQGLRVSLGDLDIVNPYYRAKDSEKELAAAGIKVISSVYANSNVDVPAMPQEAYALTDGEFNRAHVARVLMAKGYVASVDEAFKTLLKPGGGFYTPARRITAAAAIRFIKTYGAAAVMAHGLLSMSAEQMREFLPEAKNAGLDAIETRYSEYDEKDIATSVSFCEEFGLLQSGGSDFHGGTKPDIALGTGKGSLFVPYEFYENLRSRADYED